MKSKLISVRIPEDELEYVSALIDRFSGVSPALIIRALLYTSNYQDLKKALGDHVLLKATSKILSQ